MIFTTAKQNLLASFKARFSNDPKGYGYIFYPKEYEKGFACSETDYLKYTSDFQKFLKRMTRIMWSWFLVGMPLIIGLAVWQDYEFSNIEKLLIIMFPIPFLAWKGFKVFNAPNQLMKNKPTAKQRTPQQLKNDRIRGMSWLMLLALTIVPIVGIYVFITDTSLQKWQIALGLCCFATVSAAGIYLMIRKWKS